MKAICFIAGLLILLSVTGCARMELSRSNLSTHVQMNPLQGNQYKVKNHFKESRWLHYFVFRLAPTARPNLSEIISSHVTPGDLVVELEVKKQETFVNGLICALIGFIYCPETLTIEGDVATKVGS